VLLDRDRIKYAATSGHIDVWLRREEGEKTLRDLALFQRRLQPEQHPDAARWHDR
jgi:hypothetical protein